MVTYVHACDIMLDAAIAVKTANPTRFKQFANDALQHANSYTEFLHCHELLETFDAAMFSAATNSNPRFIV